MKRINKFKFRKSLTTDPGNIFPESALPFSVNKTSLLFFLCFILIGIIPIGAEGPKTAISYFNGIGFTLIIVSCIALLILLSLGRCIYSIFIQALFVRLLILACFYLVAPTPLIFPHFNITTPTLPVWDDDVHYVGAAEYIDRARVTTSEIIFEEKRLPFLNKVGRIGLLISFIKRSIGDEQIWIRYINCIMGSLTAVFIILSLRKFFSPAAQKIGAYLVILGPEFIQSSLLLYKEGYIHLGTSTLLLAMWMIAKDRRLKVSSGIVSLLGLLLLWWSRQDAFLLAAVFFALHLGVCMGKVSSRLTRKICLLVLFLSLSMALFGFGFKEEIRQSIISETSEMTGSSFGWASSLSGPARIVHIPLSFANPPPFLLHEYVLIQPGNSLWFRTIFRELRTLQWWWMMPWVVFGIWWAFFKRSGNFATFVMSYITLWFVAAISFNGVGPEVVRYRDTFLPYTVFLAVGGYEFAGKKWRSLATKITIGFVILIWLFMNLR